MKAGRGGGNDGVLRLWATVKSLVFTPSEMGAVGGL